MTARQVTLGLPCRADRSGHYSRAGTTQLPLIHLNGTSGKVLVREYADAVAAVDDAIAAVSNVTCHDRDLRFAGVLVRLPRSLRESLWQRHTFP